MTKNTIKREYMGNVTRDFNTHDIGHNVPHQLMLHSWA